MGDAFGEQFFGLAKASVSRTEARLLPSSPWPYTDDTEMALSIVSSLWHTGTIDQEHLAVSFAARYDPSQGYGLSMPHLLNAISAGAPWQELARNQFAGQGAFGNGATMRSRPLALSSTRRKIRSSSKPSARRRRPVPIKKPLLAALLPPSRRPGDSASQAHYPAERSFSASSYLLSRRARCAGSSAGRDLAPTTPVESAAAVLGNGVGLSAQDTAPLVLRFAGSSIEWDWLVMDGALTEAPLGGKKRGPIPPADAESGVKRSLLTEGHGVPIGLVVEGANRHDMKLTRPTLESVVVERPKPTTKRPQGCAWMRAMTMMRSMQF